MRLPIQVDRTPGAGRAPTMLCSESLALQGKLIAPAGRFRLVGVDTFEGPFADFLIGDFASKDEAIAEAEARGRPMNPTYVYTDTGELIFRAGKP